MKQSTCVIIYKFKIILITMKHNWLFDGSMYFKWCTYHHYSERRTKGFLLHVVKNHCSETASSDCKKVPWHTQKKVMHPDPAGVSGDTNAYTPRLGDTGFTADSRCDLGQNSSPLCWHLPDVFIFSQVFYASVASGAFFKALNSEIKISSHQSSQRGKD